MSEEENATGATAPAEESGTDKPETIADGEEAAAGGPAEQANGEAHTQQSEDKPVAEEQTIAQIEGSTGQENESKKEAEETAAADESGATQGGAEVSEEESKDIVETMASEDLADNAGQEENNVKTAAEGKGEAPKLDQGEGAAEEEKGAPQTTEGEGGNLQPSMEPITEEGGETGQLDGGEETTAIDHPSHDISSEVLGDPNVGPPERIDTKSPTDMGRAKDGLAVGGSRPGTGAMKIGEEEDQRLQEVEDEDEMSMVGEKVPDRESLIEFYQQAMKDREGLVQENTTLQNKLSEYFRRKRSEEGGPSGAAGGAATGRAEQVDRSVSDLEQRYLSFMTNLEELQLKQKESKDTYESEIASIKHLCEMKEAELEQMTSEFAEKRRLIAQRAINSRTGKPLQREEIETYMLNEQKKDQEVKAVRLENIKLKNRLQKREKQLKQKEELAEGLHLIDFEQLKIENQTYNEKIEERNEELSKLRKKITNTVEVLTHLKEKLQYIQQENGQLNQQLKGLDSQVAQKRDALTRIKQNRDKLRNENHELNRQCGLLGNETLLRDYEEKYSESADLKTRLSDLRARHSELSMKCTGYKKKIENARSGIMIR